ncbi:MAG TPA: hypothetical protein VN930_11380 [Xanthobacteraceae bacterium]|nr:hypothetical protein [Xanthobacteraceae bacterium]
MSITKSCWKISIVFGFALTGANFHVAVADTVVPRTIEYGYEVTTDANSKACRIILLLSDSSFPESVKFQFWIGRQRLQGRALDTAGFTIDVIDLKFANGQPIGSQAVDLSSANFVSPTFSSAGRFHMTTLGDGGLSAATSDLQSANAFFNALVVGTYEVSFARKGLSTIRTHKVNKAPSPDIVQQFTECLRTLS